MSANCWAPTLSTNLLYSFILSSCKVSASWKQKRFTLSKLHQSINDLQVWKVSNWIMKGCWTVDMIKMHFSINFRCSSYWTVSNLLFKAKYVKKWEFSLLFIHSFECKRRVGKTFLFTRTGPFLQSCNDGYRWHLASKIFILHISSLLASLFRPNVKYCTAISPKVLWPFQKSSQDNKPKVAVHERNNIFQTQSNKSTYTQRKDRVHNVEEENEDRKGHLTLQRFIVRWWGMPKA